MSKKTIPELLAIARQPIYTKADSDQAHMALFELDKRWEIWLKKYNGDYTSFEDQWLAFSGEDLRK